MEDFKTTISTSNDKVLLLVPKNKKTQEVV